MRSQRNKIIRNVSAQASVFKRVAISFLVAFIVAGAGCSDDKALSIEEQQIIDVRIDYLRCQIYLDRLRDLYQVTKVEPDGLMDPKQLDPGPQSAFTQLTGGADGPLTGGHDGPLTGGHDGPLTGGHDGPLTGGHDVIPRLLPVIKAETDACWDATQRLVVDYNFCVEKYVKKEGCGGNGQSSCIGIYDSCINDARTKKLNRQSNQSNP